MKKKGWKTVFLSYSLKLVDMQTSGFKRFHNKNHWKTSEMNKKIENGQKKYFKQLLGGRRTLKLVKIYNRYALAYNTGPLSPKLACKICPTYKPATPLPPDV